MRARVRFRYAYAVDLFLIRHTARQAQTSGVQKRLEHCQHIEQPSSGQQVSDTVCSCACARKCGKRTSRPEGRKRAAFGTSCTTSKGCSRMPIAVCPDAMYAYTHACSSVPEVGIPVDENRSRKAAPLDQAAQHVKKSAFSGARRSQNSQRLAGLHRTRDAAQDVLAFALAALEA